jgi:hypothetical protein
VSLILFFHGEIIMFFKKSILLGSALSLLSISVIAQATDGLLTVNNTDNISAVKLTSGKFSGICTGTPPAPLPAQYTNPHDRTTVGWVAVGLLCTNSAGRICTAQIHMSKDCSTPVIGTASFNLNTKLIENITNVPDSGFIASGQGTSTLVIDKA